MSQPYQYHKFPLHWNQDILLSEIRSQFTVRLSHQAIKDFDSKTYGLQWPQFIRHIKSSLVLSLFYEKWKHTKTYSRGVLSSIIWEKLIRLSFFFQIHQNVSVFTLIISFRSINLHITSKEKINRNTMKEQKFQTINLFFIIGYKLYIRFIILYPSKFKRKLRIG
jgi:hypothetical protein